MIKNWPFISGLLLMAATVVQAQFAYTTNNGSLTITGPASLGGAVAIPATINNLPVTAIANSAFTSSKMTSVIIPGSVTNIGNNAFGNCFNLASVTLTNGLISIGQTAFANGSSLTWITIPPSVVSFGFGAFSSCVNLVGAYFMGNSPPANPTAFNSDNNAIVYYFPGTTGWSTSFGSVPVMPFPFSYQTNAGTINITGYSGTAAVLAIPATLNYQPVTSIGTNVFAGSTNLTKIYIPTSVSAIGDGAFANTGLTNITIPASVTNLGNYAFYLCTNLASLAITNGLMSIGNYDFYGCTKLTGVTIPTSVTSIGSNAFSFCTNLSNVYLPYSVTSIGQSSFFDTAESSIIVPSSVTNIGSQAFASCASLSTVYFTGNAPASGSTLFSGDSLAMIYYLPGTSGWRLTYAGVPTVLWTPYSYTSIPSSGVEIFGYSPQAGTMVNIPAGINGVPVTQINASAFSFDGITGVIIPGSVTSMILGFQNCPSLTNVYCTGNAPTFMSSAFAGDTNATVYYFPGTTGWSTTAGGAPAVLLNPYLCTTNNGGITITGYTGPAGVSITIPATLNGLPVTGIGNNAFAGSSLAGVTFPSSVTSIGSQAFAGASLTSVIIPDSVTSLGSQAFVNCTSLTNAFITGNAPATDGTLFANDTLTTVYYLPGTTGWSSTFAGVPTTLWIPYYFTTNGGSITITGYAGPGGTKISIPASINSLPVTSIGNSFQYSSMYIKFTSITIPASITNIASFALSGCPTLTSMYFQGNAPTADTSVFAFGTSPMVYYLPGTTGWSSTFAGRPTVLWNPQVQTGDGSFGIQSNQFGFNLTGPTNLTLVVNVSTNLSNPGWTPLQTVTLTNGLFYFSEPVQTNGAGRFYRLSSP